MLPPDWSDRLAATLSPHPHVLPQGRPAAVLLLLAGSGPDVLLTERAQHLPHHPGQICLPGGRVDAGDRDACAAALRETEEEVGLASAHVTLLGCLAPLATVTGFAVQPVVGRVAELPGLTPQPDEVARILTLPLAGLLAPGALEWRQLERNGRLLDVPFIVCDGEVVWGATAHMLLMLGAALGVSR
ncbi:NUDIX hydrolase [Chitinibacteraceae bacterium HSL-7]